MYDTCTCMYVYDKLVETINQCAICLYKHEHMTLQYPHGRSSKYKKKTFNTFNSTFKA
jgi:hypothetical protein